MQIETLTYGDVPRDVSRSTYAAAALAVWEAVKKLPDTPGAKIEAADQAFEDTLQQYPLALE